MTIGSQPMNRAVLIFGGDGGERHVSIASAANLCRHYEFDTAYCIERDGSVRRYLPMQLQEHVANFSSELDCWWSHAGASIENWLKTLQRLQPVCFIALHGRAGEDGTFQAALEAAGLPFTGSGSAASRTAFDKMSARVVAAEIGLSVAEGAEYDSAAESELRHRFGSGPVIVKPCTGGSSLGLSLHDNIESAFKHLSATPQPRMLIERFIRGRELSCAVIERPDGSYQVLPPVEIQHSRLIFDYDEKYGVGAREICPAPLTADETRQIQEQSLLIHRALGCEGYSRSDFIHAEDWRLVYLETNSLPGLSEKSLLPLSLATAGISLTQFIQEQIVLAQPKGAPAEPVPDRAEAPRSRLWQQDPLYAAAVGLVLEERRASASFVQRRLKLGFNRAARLVGRMELDGLVGPQGPGGNREILVTKSAERIATQSHLGTEPGVSELRNVEIKARVADLAPLEALLAKRTGKEAALLSQRDFFFHCPSGRLKMRFEGSSAERALLRAHLIHYRRPDGAGAKLSRYSIAPVAEPDDLLDVLEAAYGLAGQVSKLRWLFELGRTRVHLDMVEGLGYFVELEVRLNEGDSIEDGEREAYALLEELGVARENCLKGAYLDYSPLHPNKATAMELPVLTSGQ